LKFGVIERPARMRHPFAPFEIYRVEFRATSAPNGGGPAEEAQPRMGKLVIILPDVLAAIEVGDVGFVI
jgi:hypothetical protein